MFLFDFIGKILFGVYGLYTLLGATLNGILLYLMFRHTPEKFKVFGWMMKVHSSFDMIGTFASFFTMQRIIPCGWSLLYISYGPCGHIGSWACYIGYMMSLFVYVITFYITLWSFFARLYIVHHGTISKARTLLYLAAALPIPLAFAFCFLTSKSDDNVMKAIMNETYPHYFEEDLIITGNEDIKTWQMGAVMFIITGLITPLYAVILHVRGKCLDAVSKANLNMSLKTKEMHKQFVNMLTLQALLPLVLIIAVVTFFIGQFFFNHPALESASIIIGQTPSILSPIIVFCHVPTYQRVLKRIILRQPATPSDSSNQNSQDHGSRKASTATKTSTATKKTSVTTRKTSVTIRSNLIQTAL